MLPNATSPRQAPSPPHPVPGASSVTRRDAASERGARATEGAGAAGRAERGATMTEYLPEIAIGNEGLLDECESVWKQMEECQTKLMLLRTEMPVKSHSQLSLLMMQGKALAAECSQWQKRSPEVVSTDSEVLLALGKEELQKVKNELEMMLSTVQSKTRKLDEDLKREQQWYDEQKQILDVLNEKESKTQDEQLSKKSLNARTFCELQNNILKIKMYKEELLSSLGGFLEEHFPHPEKGGSGKKEDSSEDPAVKLITLHEILEILINEAVTTPHEPYVTINDSFWPPYIELLLRSGIALRHPEDPNRMRLEAFHM
ncbi:centromere protein K [Colius striatus]|uniref:centromere protein K n=1 Tax=Colius striatus TaxID=57412 RepID=UPI002B1D1F0F|nr:centromere protein K [Colius striatus]